MKRIMLCLLMVLCVAFTFIDEPECPPYGCVIEVPDEEYEFIYEEHFGVRYSHVDEELPEMKFTADGTPYQEGDDVPVFNADGVAEEPNPEWDADEVAERW